jgi:hypothetical protein
VTTAIAISVNIIPCRYLLFLLQLLPLQPPPPTPSTVARLQYPPFTAGAATVVNNACSYTVLSWPADYRTPNDPAPWIWTAISSYTRLHQLLYILFMLMIA